MNAKKIPASIKVTLRKTEVEEDEKKKTHETSFDV